MTNNVIRLHFNKEANIEPCMKELEGVTPHKFKWERVGVNPRVQMSIPEAAEAEAVALLTFEDGDRCRDFMIKPECRKVYDKFSG